MNPTGGQIDSQIDSGAKEQESVVLASKEEYTGTFGSYGPSDAWWVHRTGSGLEILPRKSIPYIASAGAAVMSAVFVALWYYMLVPAYFMIGGLIAATAFAALVTLAARSESSKGPYLRINPHSQVIEFPRLERTFSFSDCARWYLVTRSKRFVESTLKVSELFLVARTEDAGEEMLAIVASARTWMMSELCTELSQLTGVPMEKNAT